MVVTRKSLSKKFSLYSDAELLEEYRSGGLTELATEVAKAELAKRGIDAAKPAPAAPPAPEPEPEEVPEPLIDGDLVMVARLFDATEAEMLRGLLEAEGVPAMVADAHTSRAISFLQTAIGGVRILVPSPIWKRRARFCEPMRAATTRSTTRPTWGRLRKRRRAGQVRSRNGAPSSVAGVMSACRLGMAITPA